MAETPSQHSSANTRSPIAMAETPSRHSSANTRVMPETPSRIETNNNVTTYYWDSSDFVVEITHFSNIYLNADEVIPSDGEFDNYEQVSDYVHDDNEVGGDYVDDELGIVVGQLETEVPNKPASKQVVENLTIVTVTKDEVNHNNALCTICNYNMGVGEKAKLLPCSHRYHGSCIDQWLGVRNTCPVCRYELPIHDPESDRSSAGVTN